VCCNSACAGACDVCNAPGTIGTCTPIAAGSSGTPSCAPFVCGGGAACPTTCTLAAQCIAGKVCTGGACVDPVADAGAADVGAADAGAADAGAESSVADTGVADALADAVVDADRDTGLGLDAADAAPEVGDASDASDAAEQTTPPVTTTTGLHRCKLDADCGGGVCVEGFCCDTACRGTCMSCVLAAAPGKCLPQPNGYDLHGDCQSSSCRSVCGGRGTCEAAVAGSQCARAQCTDQSHGKGPAVCPGLGAACPLDQQVDFDCHEYGCFAPTGTCLTACTSSEDCALGALCDLTSNKCVVAATPSSDSGGCAAAPFDANATGATPAGGLVALLGLAAAVARRRRARR
jgi:MYXO-CTERM domain-containing protein